MLSSFSPFLAGFGPLGTPELIIIGILLAVPVGVILLVVMLVRMSGKQRSGPPRVPAPTEVDRLNAQLRGAPPASAPPQLPPQPPE